MRCNAMTINERLSYETENEHERTNIYFDGLIEIELSDSELYGDTDNSEYYL